MLIANNSTKGKGVFYIINFIFLKKEKREGGKQDEDDGKTKRSRERYQINESHCE